MLALQRARESGLRPSGSIAGVGAAVEAVFGIGLLAGSVYLYKRHPFASGIVGTLGTQSLITAAAIEVAGRINSTAP